MIQDRIFSFSYGQLARKNMNDEILAGISLIKFISLLLFSDISLMMAIELPSEKKRMGDPGKFTQYGLNLLNGTFMMWNKYYKKSKPNLVSRKLDHSTIRPKPRVPIKCPNHVPYTLSKGNMDPLFKRDRVSLILRLSQQRRSEVGTHHIHETLVGICPSGFQQ